MIIYKDVISGDEVLSDSFDFVEVDDIVYEVKTQMIDKKDDYDEDDQGGQVNNFVDALALAETTFDKKSYTSYIKGYMQKIKSHLESTNPDRVKPFMTAASGFVKKILTTFDEYEFYTGESMSPDGLVLLKFYKGQEIDPYFYVFKDGLNQEKV